MTPFRTTTPARDRVTPRPHGPLGRAAAIVVAVLIAASLAICPNHAHAQDNPLEPLDTSSPRATYESFVDQIEVLEDLLLTYQRDRTEANQDAFGAEMQRVQRLFDFSEVADANESEAVVVSFARLADIVNRIPPPDLDEIPDVDDVEAAGSGTGEFTLPGTDVPPELSRTSITDYTLPGSEITIARIDEGDRAGEYLFSSDTVSRLGGWRDEVDDLPVNDGVDVRNWVHEEADFTGHLVPRSLIDAFPDSADREFLGTPLWKFIADMLMLGVVAALTVVWHRGVGRRGVAGSTSGYMFRLTTPLVLLVLLGVARRWMDEQINHSGDAATIVNLIVTFAVWLAMAWGFWILTRLVVEWIIATPSIRDESIDAHLLRLLAKVVSIVGAIAIAWIGLSRIGIPTVGLGIGAGVIGLAVGLAATSTLENLLGGITVYLDKPFRVDDRISVDDEFGTVEAIGPRSTRIRRLDDTQVTLPNADISKAKVTNYSQRHYILFVHTVGVRYETTIDQLRTIVGEIDRRFRSHPEVLDEPDYPRVRVAGFGSSSIDIEVRAHVDTDNYGEFTGVQEELLLIIYEIVETAGSGFAFPSTTTYLADDSGLARPAEDGSEAPAAARVDDVSGALGPRR